jgi:hypothetical protein
MNKVEQLGSFIARVTSDLNLSSSHISLCTALCSAWVTNELSNPFNVTRKNMMTAARIKSKSTYHKIIKDLVEFKYLEYYPSFHPKNGSRVYILSP